MPTRRPSAIVLWAACVALAVSAAGCPDERASEEREPSAPQTAPATQPEDGPGGDWPAFQRGGPLLGRADPIGPPPMAVRWTYRIEGAGVENSAAIVGGTVYVADDRDTLHAIDLITGQGRWTYKAQDGFATAPLVAGGRVLLGDLSGTFHAVSADAGRRLWTFDSGGSINSSANLSAVGVAFANDVGRMTCLDPSDGRKISACEIPQTNGAAAVSGQTAWVGSCDGKLRAIDLRTGQELLAVEVEGEMAAAPALIDGAVVAGTMGGRVVCIDADSGTARWEYDPAEGDAMMYSSVAVADGVVVVGARDNRVHAIDAASGQRRWVFQTQGEVDSSPAVSGGRVYVGSKDGKFYVLGLSDGRPLWQFAAGGAITAGPAVGRGVVVFADTDGNVYCLEPRRSVE